MGKNHPGIERTHTEIVDLPFEIEVAAKNELTNIQNTLTMVFGRKVFATNVGTDDEVCVGLVHLGTAEHWKLVEELIAFYAK